MSPNASPIHEVVVVGGGPAGAATAFFLARAGVDVTVLDRAHFPRPKPCAEYLSPEAARLLDEMGALERLEQEDVTRLTGMTVVAPNGARIRGDFSSANGFRGYREWGLGCRREMLDLVLLDCARHAGARVIEGSKVSDVLRRADGTVYGVRTQQQEFRAELVVGADGLRSVVARRLSLVRRTWPTRIAIMAHYRNVRGMTTHGEMHVRENLYFGMAQVASGITNVALVLTQSEFRKRHALHGSATNIFEQFIAQHPEFSSRFVNATREGKVRSTGPFASHARRATLPGALLVGDAADFFDPFTGEGIYAALRGGELAAPHIVDTLTQLSTSGATKAWRTLAQYDRQRRATFGGKWRVEKLIGLAVAFPALLNRVARVLERDREFADLLVGVTGDFVPASEVLRPRMFLRVLGAHRPQQPSVTQQHIEA